jgi:hypothetical protein
MAGTDLAQVRLVISMAKDSAKSRRVKVHQPSHSGSLRAGTQGTPSGRAHSPPTTHTRKRAPRRKRKSSPRNSNSTAQASANPTEQRHRHFEAEHAEQFLAARCLALRDNMDETICYKPQICIAPQESVGFEALFQKALLKHRCVVQCPVESLPAVASENGIKSSHQRDKHGPKTEL